MGSSDAIRLFITEPVLQQRLAKLIVLECFRNSALEDLHAGISPCSATGDYSDVLVNSPYGYALMAADLAVERRRDEATHDRRRRSNLSIYP